MAMFDPIQRLHVNHNMRLPEELLEKLDSESLSYRYFNQQETYSSNLFSKLKIMCNIPYYLDQLIEFYPFHERITTANKNYFRDFDNALKKGAAVSAISIFSIYQMARRGKVLPFLSKYGRFLKTHRLFRHYAWALVLPTTFFCSLVDWQHIDNVEKLWSIHARRMQQGVVDDPDGTVYPDSLLPINLKTVWHYPYVSPTDMAAKQRNEVPLAQAPDYENPEFEAVDLPQAAGEDEEGEEEEDEE